MSVKNKLLEKQAERNMYQKQLKKYQLELVQNELDLVAIEEAQNIIQITAKGTQEKVKEHIEDLVSTALADIFENPYELSIEFDIKRNKTEADLFLVRGNEKIKPGADSCGGSVMDVLSFALRLALWSLQSGDKARVLFLDEGFKFLSAKYQPFVGQMLKNLSEKLELQIILITHKTAITEYADNIINVSMKNGKSQVSCKGID